MRPLRHLAAMLLLAGATLAPLEAAAARSVEWTAIEVRPGDDQKRVEKNLRELLRKATRKAKWGKGSRIELSAKVTRFEWETKGDVLRLTVTVVARLGGGETARSHIRVGGKPTESRKIEREALTIVASGLVTRLAEMARAR